MHIYICILQFVIDTSQSLKWDDPYGMWAKLEVSRSCAVTSGPREYLCYRCISFQVREKFVWPFFVINLWAAVWCEVMLLSHLRKLLAQTISVRHADKSVQSSSQDRYARCKQCVFDMFDGKRKVKSKFKHSSNESFASSASWQRKQNSLRFTFISWSRDRPTIGEGKQKRKQIVYK